MSPDSIGWKSGRDEGSDASTITRATSNESTTSTLNAVRCRGLILGASKVIQVPDDFEILVKVTCERQRIHVLISPIPDTSFLSSRTGAPSPPGVVNWRNQVHLTITFTSG